MMDDALKRIRFALFSFFLLLSLSSFSRAGNVVIPGLSGDFNIQTESRNEIRFRTTFRQQYDYSCGSAAVATLLTYHYSDPISEQSVFKWMYEHGNQEKIRKVGFSMLDMKNYLENRGYKADGYHVKLEQLATAAIPAIVLVDIKGYKHFVVIKGITNRDVLIGDSASGIRKMTRPELESIWKGLAFILKPSEKQRAKNFNSLNEWRLIATASLGLAIPVNELADLPVLLPGPGDAGP
jgi:predicted double-glycine peptidase